MSKRKKFNLIGMAASGINKMVGKASGSDDGIIQSFASGGEVSMAYKVKELMEKNRKSKEELVETFNVSLIGDKNVGRSNFVDYLTNKYYQFPCPYINHSNVDLEVHRYNFGDNLLFKVNLFYLTWSEEYKNIFLANIRESNGVILFYDVTNEETYKRAKKFYLPMIRKNLKDKDVPIVLVGTKCDLQVKSESEKKEEKELKETQKKERRKAPEQPIKPNQNLTVFDILGEAPLEDPNTLFLMNDVLRRKYAGGDDEYDDEDELHEEDLENRQVKFEEALMFGQKNNLQFFEISCKNGKNVKTCHIQFYEKMYEHRLEVSLRPKFELDVQKESQIFNKLISLFLQYSKKIDRAEGREYDVKGYYQMLKEYCETQEEDFVLKKAFKRVRELLKVLSITSKEVKGIENNPVKDAKQQKQVLATRKKCRKITLMVMQLKGNMFRNMNHETLAESVLEENKNNNEDVISKKK